MLWPVLCISSSFGKARSSTQQRPAQEGYYEATSRVRRCYGRCSVCCWAGSCLELHNLHSQLQCCRTVKQLLDTVEQARSGDLAESQSARPQPSLTAPMQPGSSLEVPRKQSSIESSSSVQPMRASQGSLGMSSAKAGSGGLSSISMSNGSGGVPSWIGMPSAAAASKAGGNNLNSSSKPPAGAKHRIANNHLVHFMALALAHGFIFAGNSCEVLLYGCSTSIMRCRMAFVLDRMIVDKATS